MILRSRVLRVVYVRCEFGQLNGRYSTWKVFFGECGQLLRARKVGGLKQNKNSYSPEISGRTARISGFKPL